MPPEDHDYWSDYGFKTDYNAFKDTYWDSQEKAKSFSEEAYRRAQETVRERRRRAQEEAKRKYQAELDPMAEIEKIATSTYSIGEHVYFENGWGVYISRKEGEQRLSLTQIRPGNSSALHYTQLNPVQVLREMYKISQFG